MKKALAVAGIGAALLTAGTANASTSSFIEHVQDNIPYVLSQYGASALQTEGAHICAWEAQGTTGASDLADLIIAEMPMSRSAAIHLQVYAEHDLGC
jgi:hypothetical protein